VALVMAHRAQLQARFNAAATDDERRAARAEVYAALRARMPRRKRHGAVTAATTPGLPNSTMRG